MGAFSEFLSARAERDNPAYARRMALGREQEYEQGQRNLMAKMAGHIYGQQAQAAVPDQFNARPDGQPIEFGAQPDVPGVTAQPASGLFAEGVSDDVKLQLMNKRMLESGIAGFNKQWQGNQGNMQNSMMGNLGAMARQKQAQKVGSKPTSAIQNYLYGQKDPAFAKQQMALKQAGSTKIDMSRSDEPMTMAELKNTEIEDGEGGWITPPIGSTPRQVGALGGRVKDKLSAEAAGKTAMLRTAKELFPVIQSKMFDSSGKPDMSVIRDAFAITLDPTPGDFVSKYFTSDESHEIANAFEVGIQGITRTETGAAMPPEEVRNTRKRFLPGPMDGDAEILQKWNAYQFFINSASAMIDQNNRDVGLLTEQVNKAADAAFAQTAKDSTSSYDQTEGPKPGLKWVD